jgi:hypothetical protein
MLQNRGAVELSERGAAKHHLRPGQVRVSVAAESEDSLVCRNLQPRRLPVQVWAKLEEKEREARAPLVNRAGSQKAGRQLGLSAGKGNRNAERKRARGLHHQDRNYSLLIIAAASEQKFRGRSI